MAGPWEKYGESTAQAAGPWSGYGEQNPSAPAEAAPDDRGVVRKAADWALGNRREESIPLMQDAGLQLSPEQAAQMTALVATTQSDERMQAGIKNMFPDAQFDTDQYGNQVAIVPTTAGGGNERSQWTRFYTNPQGLDKNDAMRVAGVASTAALWPAKMGLLTAGALGAGEAALIEGVSSQAAGDDFKKSDVLWGALGAAGGQLLGNQLGKLFKAKNIPLRNADGSYTDDALRAFQQAGINPDDVTEGVAETISRHISQNVDPKQAGRVAQSQGLPVPVQLSRGQVTGDVGQQILENEARKNILGEGPARVMNEFADAQQAALRENIPAIQSQLGGDVLERGAGGAQAQASLAAQRTAAQANATALYDTARASGAAIIPDNYAGTMDDALFKSLSDFLPSERPGTTQILDSINEVLSTDKNVGSLFGLRRQLNNIGSPGSPDQAAAGVLKRALDEQLNMLADQAMLNGDEAVVEAHMAAIKNYADYASTWKSKGILDTLTRTATRDGGVDLVVSPEQAANYIMGSSGSGLITKPNLVRDLGVLKNQLPEADWNAVRQEAFMRIFDKAQNGAGGVTGGTFTTMLNRFSRENPAVYRALFSKDEQALFRQFAAVAHTISGSASNTSNSASSMMKIIPKLGQAFKTSSLARFAGLVPILNTTRDRAREFAVGSAVRNTAPAVSNNLGGQIGGAIGAATGGSGSVNDPIEEQMQRYGR